MGVAQLLEPSLVQPPAAPLPNLPLNMPGQEKTGKNLQSKQACAPSTPTQRQGSPVILVPATPVAQAQAPTTSDDALTPPPATQPPQQSYAQIAALPPAILNAAAKLRKVTAARGTVASSTADVGTANEAPAGSENADGNPLSANTLVTGSLHAPSTGGTGAHAPQAATYLWTGFPSTV